MDFTSLEVKGNVKHMFRFIKGISHPVKSTYHIGYPPDMPDVNSLGHTTPPYLTNGAM